MADVAADVAGLLDLVGWDRTALAGWSFGGMVAQECAVNFPARLTGWRCWRHHRAERSLRILSTN
jgi:pimeloyl-ACP methyl ester carboxylesterase